MYKDINYLYLDISPVSRQKYRVFSFKIYNKNETFKSYKLIPTVSIRLTDRYKLK